MKVYCTAVNRHPVDTGPLWSAVFAAHPPGDVPRVGNLNLVVLTDDSEQFTPGRVYEVTIDEVKNAA